MVVKEIKDITMKMKYKTGVNTKGEDIYREFNYSNLHLEATPTKIMGFANIVAKYIQYPVNMVTTTSTFVIKES